MGNKVYIAILLLFLSACASKPSSKNIPKFSFLDSLKIEKTVNCSSRDALDCMACALQGEAANQSPHGIYAVGITIMTRAKGRLDKICGITKARGQFEGMKRRGKRKITRKVMGIAKHIIESKETGWTHFWAPKTQADLRRNKPYWAYTFERKQCLNEKIGDHVFYNTNQCVLDRQRMINAQND
jgi:spore germination cell wall hydrolase CwlJ-like protein